MDERTLELVGIAASVCGHCRPCFNYHYGKARELGITTDEIDETIDLAIRISTSGDNHMHEFVRKKMRK